MTEYIKRAATDPREQIGRPARMTHPWPELVEQAKAAPGEWFEYHGWADKAPSVSPVRT
jgi:hypothetical protein